MEIHATLAAVPPADGPTALTVGKFESVHLGHQRLLRRLAGHAAAQGLMPAATAFLNDPGEVTGTAVSAGKMIWPPADRAVFMEACGIRRVVFVPFDAAVAGLSAEAFMRGFVAGTMRARFFLCGADFRFGRGASGGADECRDLGQAAGCEVAIEPPFLVDGVKVSSSAIGGLILAGGFRAAGRLLGRPYFIRGAISPGRGIGRQLGFPTLNIRYPDEVLVPEGIFAGWVEMDGRRYPAAVNSGRRPTLERDGRNVVEIHVLTGDFPRDAQAVRLFPVHKIRDEKKFSSQQALITQIGHDCEAIRKVLKHDQA
jgi:riboflavin kinase / FMN adenylyltransferase